MNTKLLNINRHRPKKLLGILFLLLIVLFAKNTFAAIDACFFVLVDKNGNVLNSSTHGRFYHVALRSGHEWLQALPYHGVHLGNSRPYSLPYKVLHHRDLNLDFEKVFLTYSEHRFDLHAGWNSPAQTNCSNLVAKALGLQAGIHGGDQLTGFSPEELYETLQRILNFKPLGKIRCHQALNVESE